MFNWPSQRRHALPIGIDIGLDGIKMLQCHMTGEHLSVLAAARMAIPDNTPVEPTARMEAVCAMIRKMLLQRSFVGNRVALSLPRSIVHVKNARLPLIPEDELTAAVEFEARNLFGFDLADATIRYLPAGEVRHGNDVRQEVIVAAVQNKDIEAFIDQIAPAGVEIDSLDIEPCAIYRAFERFIRRKNDEQEVQVFIDVGAGQSQVIIGRGHNISFFKQMDIGSQHLHQAVSRKLGITFDEARALRRRLMTKSDTVECTSDPVCQAVHDATRSLMEDLAREVSMCLRYYFVTFRGQRPTRVRIVGGEGNDPRLIALLGAALPIPVEAGKPLYSIDTTAIRSGDRSTMMSEWTHALGLSLKRAEGRFVPRDGATRIAQTELPAISAGEIPQMTEVGHA